MSTMYIYIYVTTYYCFSVFAKELDEWKCTTNGWWWSVKLLHIDDIYIYINIYVDIILYI